MAGIKEIRNHIKSVESTLKITNAMYLISSSSLRKARKQLDNVVPYFTKLSYTIEDILHHSPASEYPAFDQRSELSPEERKLGFIVVTGDKGLAGAYNHNVLKLADQKMDHPGKSSLFAIGQMGRSSFLNRGINIDETFTYTAQSPTMSEAREITENMLQKFFGKELDEVWIIYTHMRSVLFLEPIAVKLLPLDKNSFPWEESRTGPYNETVSYFPSESVVLDHIIPDYFAGMLFGALVESFCSEQSARMTAMDASSKNAKDLLRDLNLKYNRARQSAITQELTEVVGGAQISFD